MSTWALSHYNSEIREAEEESLQHSKQVARDHYQQNKQNKPQNLVQTYAREENIFPKNFKQVIDKIEDPLETKIKDKQKSRLENRIEKLKHEKAIYSKDLELNRPLSTLRRVSSVNISEFIHLVEEASMRRMEELLMLKPRDFRDNIIRIVMATQGVNGEKLRDLWVRMYVGDLKNGIRDARRDAENKGWPIKKPQPVGKDRNSWIVFFIRKACISAAGSKAKNSKRLSDNLCPAATGEFLTSKSK